MSTKTDVIEMIQRMPDDATFDSILYALEVRQGIEEGLRQLDAGEGIPLAEAMERLARWVRPKPPLVIEPRSCEL